MTVEASPNELIKELAALAEQLPYLLVSATISDQGCLGLIGDLVQKLEAAQTADTVLAIHAFALAAEQTDANSNLVANNAMLAERIVNAERYKPGHRQPYVLAKDFAELVHTLDKTLSEETRFGQRLPLPPLNDSHYSEGLYYGRDWLRRQLGSFIKDDKNKSGHIIIAADALWGKTSFALDWYRKSLAGTALDYGLPPLAGWVFIRKEADIRWKNSVSILLGLEAETRFRLNLPHPDNATAADSRNFGGEHASYNLGLHIQKFLAELSAEATRSNTKAILMIDGVDEIWGKSGERPSQLPRVLTDNLPPSVFVVLLSRPGVHLSLQGGTPCLHVELSAALALQSRRGQAGDTARLSNESANASASYGKASPLEDLCESNRQDLAKYIDDRATAIKHDDDTAALVRGLKKPLLVAAQGYLFVLKELLAPGADLGARLLTWKDNPASIPQGVKEAVVGIVLRIFKRLNQAKDENALLGLDGITYRTQVLACLALAMCLRNPLSIQALNVLLFNQDEGPNEGSLHNGEFKRAGRCGTLLWKQINESALQSAFDFASECFVSQDGVPTTEVWHPMMKEVLRAAWVFVVEKEHPPANKNDFIERLNFPVEEYKDMASLHLCLAVVSSRYWAANTLSNSTSSSSKAARAYALAWGPWHAALSNDESAQTTATQFMSNPVFLQTVFDTLGFDAHYPIDASLEALLEKVLPKEARRLFNIRRTLAQHDGMLSKGKLSVAAVLFNDLGGLEAPESEWLRGLENAAKPRSLLRLKPGKPTPFTRFLEVGGVPHSLAISADGQWLAVAVGQDVLLFRVKADGYLVHEVPRIGGHTGRVNHIVFSPMLEDGSFWLASAPFDGTVGLLSFNPEGPQASTFHTLGENTPASPWVNHVAFSPVMNGGSLWLACAYDGKINLWELGQNAPQKPMRQFDRPDAGGDHVAFSPLRKDGSLWLASAHEDGKVGLMILGSEGSEGPRAETFRHVGGHRSRVTHVDFSPVMADGSLWLATTSVDGKIGLMDVGLDRPQEETLPLLDEKMDGVNYVAFSPELGNGSVLLAYSNIYGQGGLWTVWPDRSLSHQDEVIGHMSKVNQLAFSSLTEGRMWLATASDDGKVGLLTFESERVSEPQFFLYGLTLSVSHVAFSPPSGNRSLWLASASDDGKVGLLALQPDNLQARTQSDLEGHMFPVNHVALSPVLADGTFGLASASNDGEVGLLAFEKIRPLEPLHRLRGSNICEINHLAFSPLMGDGTFWLAGAASWLGNVGYVSLLALGTDTPLPDTMPFLGGHTKCVNHVAFSSVREDGSLWLASASDDNKVGLQLLGPAGSKEGVFRLLDGHKDRVTHVAFSPLLEDGSLWLASASDDGNVGLMDVGLGRKLADSMNIVFGGNASSNFQLPIRYVAFSPVLADDTLWLAFVRSDSEIMLVALEKQGRIAAFHPIHGHTSFVYRVTFSPKLVNGSVWMASVHDDCTVGLMDVGQSNLSQALRFLHGHTNEVCLVAFSLSINTPMRLASATRHEVIIWSIPDGNICTCVSFTGTGETIHELRWSADGTLLHVAGSLHDAPIDLTLVVPADLSTGDH